MPLMQQKKSLFEVELLPLCRFHLISPMAPFIVGQRRQNLFFLGLPEENQQINLVVKEKTTKEIIGAAVLKLEAEEAIITDFFILERSRYQGAGSLLMNRIENIAVQRGCSSINTGNSLHADNTGTIDFLSHCGFVHTPVEIHYFEQLILSQHKRLRKIINPKYAKFITEDGRIVVTEKVSISVEEGIRDSLMPEYMRFLPKHNRIVPFNTEYFDYVYKILRDVFKEYPFYSDQLIYQILLSASEKYSRVLVENERVNAFVITSCVNDRIHLHIVNIRNEVSYFGVLGILLAGILVNAIADGKTRISYLFYKTDSLFKAMRQFFEEPKYIIIKMEKTL